MILTLKTLNFFSETTFSNRTTNHIFQFSTDRVKFYLLLNNLLVKDVPFFGRLKFNNFMTPFRPIFDKKLLLFIIDTIFLKNNIIKINSAIFTTFRNLLQKQFGFGFIENSDLEVIADGGNEKIRSFLSSLIAPPFCFQIVSEKNTSCTSISL